jgi:hypothetical protein
MQINSGPPENYVVPAYHCVGHYATRRDIGSTPCRRRNVDRSWKSKRRLAKALNLLRLLVPSHGRGRRFDPFSAHHPSLRHRARTAIACVGDTPPRGKRCPDRVAQNRSITKSTPAFGQRSSLTLIGCCCSFLLVAFLTPALIAASIVAPPIFSRWFLSTSPWIVWPLLGTATLAMAWLARWFRDVRKSKYYALLEMPVGVALALQGVVQQGLMLSQRATFVVALIAFVAGLRITTDGWKRFSDNDTKSLFSLQHLLRALRKS